MAALFVATKREIWNKVNGAVLDNVVYISGFTHTLSSVKELIDQGMKVEFTAKECLVYNKPMMSGTVRRGVYTLSFHAGIAAVVFRQTFIEDWHQQLGNLNYQSIIDLAKSDAVKGLKIVGAFALSKTCKTNALSKSRRHPTPSQASRSPLAQNEVCHGGLAESYQRSYHGNRNYYTLKWKGNTNVYFLKENSDAARCFREYMNLVNRRFNKVDDIKIYRSDNGGKLSAGDFRKIYRYFAGDV